MGDNKMFIVIVAIITTVLMGASLAGLVSSETAMVGMLLSTALIVADLIGLYIFKHYNPISCTDCIYMNTETGPTEVCLTRRYQLLFMPYEVRDPLFDFNTDGICTNFTKKETRN